MRVLAMFKSRVAAIVLVVLVTAIAAGACAKADPVPTATPAPSPTPVNTPTLIRSIRIDQTKDPVGFLNSIPASEVECGDRAVVGRLNLTAIISGRMASTAAQAAALTKCMSRDTVLRVAVGQIELQAGPLSNATLICVAGRVPEIGFESLLNAQPDPAALVGVLQALFCLNNDERSALEANVSAGRFSFGGVGIGSLECIVKAIGPARLADILGAITASAGLVSPDTAAFQKVMPFIPTILTCGVDISKLGGGQLLPPSSTPAAQTTDLPLPTISGSPQPKPDLPQTDLTPEQLTCLSTKVGPDLLASVQAGSLDPSKLLPLLGALSQCNIDLTRLLATPVTK